MVYKSQTFNTVYKQLYLSHEGLFSISYKFTSSGGWTLWFKQTNFNKSGRWVRACYNWSVLY